MGKTCAFFGNDYDFMHGRKRVRCPNLKLKELIKKQAIRLIEQENVTDFLVGQIGGFEQDAYDTVLEIKNDYPRNTRYLTRQRTESDAKRLQRLYFLRTIF